jgi:acetyl-CoA C-acetyltransferase
MGEIVIVSAVRTPFWRYGGSLRDFDYFDLGAIVMREVLRRVDVEGSVVDEVYWGVGDTSVCKDVFTPVAARQTLLKAGLPPETPSISIDMACVSAMSAIQLGVRAMKLGEIESAIGGGATSFSREPLILRGLRFNGFRLGDLKLEDPLYELGYKDFNPVAVDTGNLAVEYGISREEQDDWAFRSHQRYGRAYQEGKFREEILPIEIPQKGGGVKVLDIDEQYRPNIDRGKLAQLHTVYGSPTVTAGNAPGLNDGATAILFMAKEKAERLSIPPLASIIAITSVALKPDLLAVAPGHAIERVLSQAELTLDDIDIIEINEAFAAVPLVSTKYLAQKLYNGDREKLELLRSKTNVNGSAIAVGHPNTSSGARIIMNLAYELKRRGGGYATGAICGGLAQAGAVVIKVDKK